MALLTGTRIGMISTKANPSMHETAPSVNETFEFLRALGGKIFLRAIHPDWDTNKKEPSHLRPRQHYGDPASCMAWLEERGFPINDGSTPSRRYSLFYVCNDPGQGEHSKDDDIAELRVIYQDCDDTSVALEEPEIDGLTAHFVIESSPGKRQRIWLTESLPIHLHRAIHDHMVQRHHHDHSTHGPNRLLRLPGSRNWKYEGGPYATIIRPSNAPRLTLEQVNRHFGFKAFDRPIGNIENAAHNAQRSGQLPDGRVIDLEKERSKRLGTRSTDEDAARRERDAHNASPAQLPTSRVLDALSLLDPDCHRNEWRRVLAALHYMAADRDWGRALAEQWSALAGHRYDPAAFETHWLGLSRDVKKPASWLTILRLTSNLKHNDTSRARRWSAAFKRFEEEFGPTLDYEQTLIQYPDIRKLGSDDGGAWVPDPKSRRNVEYLLELEGMTVFHDVFAQTDMVEEDGEIREITNSTLVQLYSTAHSTRFRIEASFLAQQVEAIASDVKRDPVREYLQSLPAWDGVERLSTVFQRLMGAPDTPSIRETLVLVMIAIIRRTYQPGYKFDIMPILEGKQLSGKSSFFKLLMPDVNWFSESPKLDEEPKRLLSLLQGKLVVEFAELAGFSKHQLGAVKKLVTQQFDEWTPNYARKKVRAPRRCIMIGTIDQNQYLRDLTGNRRFPIIPVQKELSYAELLAERDQLWAEAWLMEPLEPAELRFSPEAVRDMEGLQRDRLDINTETAAFMAEMEHLPFGWMTIETVWERLGIPTDKRSMRTGPAQYVIKEIKDLLERDGWLWQKTERIPGRGPARVIVKKEDRKLPKEIVCASPLNVLAYKDDLNNDLEDILK